MVVKDITMLRIMIFHDVPHRNLFQMEIIYLKEISVL